ncbi:MAG TPA: VanZ family protein [Candidatus Angelobacter sp.]|nr:VanZ family protein [Candidatus Angelobacter sp.]
MASSALQSSAAPRGKNILLWWLPTLMWLGVLAWFSTDSFSAEHTGSVLWKIIHTLYGSISPAAFEQLHFIVRKSAHFLGYGLLSGFAFSSLRATFPAMRQWWLRWSLPAWLLALLAGSFDEFHQTFVASRTPSPRDVLIDVTGALFFQLVIACMVQRKMLTAEARRRSKKPEQSG